MLQTVEFQILDAIASLRCGLLDAVMPFITSLANGGLIWIALGFVLCCFQKTRRAGICVLLALLADLILCNGLIKPLFGRIRPFYLKEVSLLVAPPTDGSFPSGHTAASFAAVSALFFMKVRKKLLIPALILAVLISFSRLYLYLHYPTDVLAGILLGCLCGYLSLYITRRICEKWEIRHKDRSSSGGTI